MLATPCGCNRIRYNVTPERQTSSWEIHLEDECPCSERERRTGGVRCTLCSDCNSGCGHQPHRVVSPGVLVL